LTISTPTTPSAIGPLLEVSARLGRNAHLVQAATGNTSMKRDGVLWIKASGRWLADATRDEIFFPLSLADILNRIDAGVDPSDQPGYTDRLRPSVETAMHAVLPFSVVLHIHSVNTIAWAVRRDGPAELARRLEGIAWQWVPYTPSGLPLANAVKAAMARAPGARVLVLANHGLVIGGDDCEEAEALLSEVERRTEIAARGVPEPAWRVLSRIAGEGAWRLPEAAMAIHALGTDATAHRIVLGGILYPCQRIFLTPRAWSFSADIDGNEIRCMDEPFVIIKSAGTLLRKGLGAAELAILVGLAEILLRIPESAPVQYLSRGEIQDLLSANVYNYPQLAQRNIAI